MNPLDAVLLGVAQGVTEILPVSSDGHLAILMQLIRLDAGPRLSLTAVLHIGTGLAMIVFFARRAGAIVRSAVGRDMELRNESRQMLGKLALATVPVVVAGPVLENLLDRLTASITVVGVCLAGNGLLLLLTRWVRVRVNSVGWLAAGVIGLAQVLALLPGVSRSGTTISVALLLGVSGTAAFEFSFLLAIPATLGAGFYSMAKEWSKLPSPGFIALGLVCAFGFGLAGLHLLRGVVRANRMAWFGVYCLIVALWLLVGT